ncbi:hypothetical protein E4T56_gene19729, partial [Termitomyces sp. T112]
AIGMAHGMVGNQPGLLVQCVPLNGAGAAFQHGARRKGHGNTGHQNSAALDQQNAAHTAHGDDLGLTSRSLKFLAKAMDIDLDGIRAEQILRPEQLVLGQPFGHHLSIPAQPKPQQSRPAP